MKFWLGVAALGAVLNLADAYLTYWAVSHNLATEFNPIMATLLASSPGTFFLAKLGAGLLFLGLGCLSPNRYAELAVGIGCLAYVGVIIYHLAGLTA